MSGWEALDEELARHAAPIPFWWRDDDAVAATPALDRLLDLAEAFDAPPHLAVIPAELTPGLAPRLSSSSARVLVHGWRHRNHAPATEKKAEFRAHRPLADRLGETKEGLRRLGDAFGPRLLPVFVPPWNRIADDLAAPLAAQGYRALSTYGPRKARDAAPGLLQINTHLDPIDWRGTRSAVPADLLAERLAEILRMRRLGESDAEEPVGLLTHHLAHDAAIWAVVEALLRRLASAARWIDLDPCLR